MTGLARRPLSSMIAGRHARLRGAAGLRGVCLTTLIALVGEFGLGEILNLYVAVPSSDAHASYVQEVANGPIALTAHILLGVVLISAAIVLLARAIGMGDWVMTGLAGTGLVAIMGAFAAGEKFLRNGQTSVSLWMAILTGVALVCYIGALNLMRVFPAQAAPRPPEPAYMAERRSDYPGSAPRPHPMFTATGPQPYSVPEARPWEEQAAAPPRRQPYRNQPPDEGWGRAPWEG
jgi:hypothetical protein